MKILDIPVEPRETLGSAEARRLRRAGKVPCILYGRGHDNVALTTTRDAVHDLLDAHTHIIRLQLGEVSQTALVREMTWDHLGEHVQHMDFVRVAMEDDVKVTVPLKFTGDPAGLHTGGVIEVLISDLEVRCRVDIIPEQIVVDISALEIGDGVHVDELPYPQGVQPERSGRDLLVHVVLPRKVELEEAKPEEAVIEGEAAPEEAPAEGAPSDEAASGRKKGA
ncbi:MAG: 50S ribosomal protein L25 [Planctomycetota bacterium]|nr:50S ribosomal protein L25 [Planctomycetota bacterium]